MKYIIIGTEKLFNAQIKFDYEDGYPPTINNSKCTTNLLNTAKKIVNKGAGKPYLSMGGEDFSYLLEKKPGSYLYIGQGDENHKAHLHTTKYDFNDNLLPIGVNYWVELVKEYFSK